MRTGDLRRAGTELRRAVDGDPRNVTAVTDAGAAAGAVARSSAAGARCSITRSACCATTSSAASWTSSTLRALVALLDAARAAARGGGRRRSGRRCWRRRAAPRARAPRPIARSAFRAPRSTSALPARRCRRAFASHAARRSPPAAERRELAQQLARHGVARADRLGAATAPRPIFDAVAAELGAGDFNLFVKTPAGAAAPVRCARSRARPPRSSSARRSSPSAPAAVRFAAGAHAAAGGDPPGCAPGGPPEEAGALLVGIIRQFVPEYPPPRRARRAGRRGGGAGRAADAAQAASRRRMPFAIESAGAFDIAALHAAVRDGANAAGLLASADLPAALCGRAGVVRDARPATLTLSPIVAHPEALALLRFAVSDAYDELAEAYGGARAAVAHGPHLAGPPPGAARDRFKAVCPSATPAHRPTIR